MDVSIKPPAPDVDDCSRSLFRAFKEINFNGTDDVLSLSKMGIGDSALKIDVNGQDIIQVNFSPDDVRDGSMTFDGSEGGNFSIMVDEVLDARVTFTMKNVSDVYDDLPDVLSDDTIGLRMDGSEMPTLQTIENGRVKDVKSCRSADSIESQYGAGCRGRGWDVHGLIDEDNLSEEEKEGRRSSEISPARCAVVKSV